MIATNGIAQYLPEIPLPNQNSTTHRRNFILQVVNKITSIRLTSKPYMSLSQVYVNQGGASLIFVIYEVNLLFYIIRRNPPHKT